MKIREIKSLDISNWDGFRQLFQQYIDRPAAKQMRRFARIRGQVQTIIQEIDTNADLDLVLCEVDEGRFELHREFIKLKFPNGDVFDVYSCFPALDKFNILHRHAVAFRNGKPFTKYTTWPVLKAWLISLLKSRKMITHTTKAHA